jgi:macrolide-specific efflux system membrane fusion protein
MIKFIKWCLIISIVAAIIVFAVMKFKPKKDSGEMVKEINPTIGSIQATISTTGTVLPKNRLEIKPPVNGRVESILVKEGEMVKVGQMLAWMSSTERAALLDAAQAQGPEQLKYWQEAYKPVALLAPIAGEVIVATIQPGTAVTTADAVVVLSDQLIVRAQVDETDIGKIALGQEAVLSLDAYPDTKIRALVEHIYYESKTVNNVTIYEADLTPEDMPSFFRSGMNATINFIIESKDSILIVPLEAVQKDKDESFVLVKESADKEPVRRAVVTGASDDRNVEIVSGLSQGDTIAVKTKKFSLPKNDIGKNPFTPFGNRKEPESKPK